MAKKGFVFLLIMIYCLLSELNAKDLYEISSIRDYFERIDRAGSDNKKIEINDELVAYFLTFLEKSESFDADFDSIVNYVSVLRSDDNLLNVFTWNIYFEDGSFKYFGFLQYKSKDKIKVYFLNDKKHDVGDDNDGVVRRYLSNMEWYGAIYYEIITKKWQSKTYYTLIGWDGADFLVNRKVLEALHFDRYDLPIFGGNVFRFEKNNHHKLEFVYSDKATMLLRYNEKHDMIVLDHLAPPDNKYQGMFQYYGPDMSYDGFVFRNGKWILQENIDANIAINYKKNKTVNNIKRRGYRPDF